MMSSGLDFFEAYPMDFQHQVVFQLQKRQYPGQLVGRDMAIRFF